MHTHTQFDSSLSSILTAAASWPAFAGANVSRQLLEVGFTHDPKHIIVIDSSSKTYTVRVRNKSKKQKTMVLGRGWKKFQVANGLRKGDVIKHILIISVVLSVEHSYSEFED
ncbi:hypothetical protein PIB30_086211 [Stylosanthes scabra]|uniref:TF-B3 domain-containing protein n=1 Tax=Stylosanthes scabra TaxID=79078 RepID=A0ABU6ZRS8_9FABA|nr:hypothetical protein [Stylosanthes scabra]